MTTEALFRASASPSPVRVLTPESGDAAIASCPCSRSFLTSLDPISPLPPITTIFMIASALFRLLLVVVEGCDRYDVERVCGMFMDDSRGGRSKLGSRASDKYRQNSAGSIEIESS